jgi:hypothetical protein
MVSCASFEKNRDKAFPDFFNSIDPEPTSLTSGDGATSSSEKVPVPAYAPSNSWA